MSDVLTGPKSADDLRGLEYDWLACDGVGHVALFSTAGGGFAPPEFLRDTDAHDAAIERLRAAPITTRPRFAPGKSGCIDLWRDVATRGVFAYDASFHGGPYRLIAAPWVPARLRALPDPVSAIAGQVVFRELRFEDMDEISEELLRTRGRPDGLVITDLTAALWAAKRKGRSTRERFDELGMRMAARVQQGGWDWEEGSEEWGCVYSGTELAARLWRPGAFALVDLRHGASIVDDLRACGVACEIVADWDRPTYRVNPDDACALFDRDGFSDRVDLSAMSAAELWYEAL